jgi:hypothetical protein
MRHQQTSGTDISFIIAQIDICLNLAAECGDPEIAAALAKLAKASADRAGRLVGVSDPPECSRKTFGN